MRVRGGGCCVFGVVGPCWILLPGGRAVLCWELNSLGWLTGERESRVNGLVWCCLLYTSPSPRDATLSRMPSSA